MLCLCSFVCCRSRRRPVLDLSHATYAVHRRVPSHASDRQTTARHFSRLSSCATKSLWNFYSHRRCLHLKVLRLQRSAPRIALSTLSVFDDHIDTLPGLWSNPNASPKRMLFWRVRKLMRKFPSKKVCRQGRNYRFYFVAEKLPSHCDGRRMGVELTRALTSAETRGS